VFWRNWPRCLFLRWCLQYFAIASLRFYLSVAVWPALAIGTADAWAKGFSDHWIGVVLTLAAGFTMGAVYWVIAGRMADRQNDRGVVIGAIAVLGMAALAADFQYLPGLMQALSGR
jgi:hypothetical protein